MEGEKRKMKKVLLFLLVFLLMSPMGVGATIITYQEGPATAEVKLISYERIGNDLSLTVETRVIVDDEISDWWPGGLYVHDYFLLSSPQASSNIEVREFGKLGAIPLTDVQTAANKPKDEPKKKEQKQVQETKKEEPKKKEPKKEETQLETEPQKEKIQPTNPTSSTSQTQKSHSSSRSTSTTEYDTEKKLIEVTEEVNSTENLENENVEGAEEDNNRQRFIELLPSDDRLHLLYGQTYPVILFDDEVDNIKNLNNVPIEVDRDLESNKKEDSNLFSSVKNFFSSISNWFNKWFS